MTRATQSLLLAAVWFLLSSCGGGVTTSPPQAPTLTLNYQQTKDYRFDWPFVSGATEFRLLEDATGSSGYSEVALLNSCATGFDHYVFLPERTHAVYKLRACNNAGCSESAAASAEPDEQIRAIGYFKASNTEADDLFGIRLAISADGATLAVGATGESSSATGVNGNQDDNSAAGSGAVYVFVRDRSGVWSQQAYLKASNAEAGDSFGHALALSENGDVLAVGAYKEDGNGQLQGDNSAGDSGAVYVFTRDTLGNWAQQAYIKALYPDPGDEFGFSLSLSGSGDLLAVGADRESSNATGVNGDQTDNSAQDSGAAYLFSQNQSGAWVQTAYLKASNTESQDIFGFRLALSSDGATLAVGAIGEDSGASGVNGDQSNNSRDASGAVYVFRYGGGVWRQEAYLKAQTPKNVAYFGSSLALSGSGDLLAAGAPWEHSAGSNAGAAYVFSRSGNTWLPQARLESSDLGPEDNFGADLALSASGRALAVGASEESSNATGVGGDEEDNSLTRPGAAYLFTNESGGWRQTAYIKASNTGEYDRFGGYLALSADGQTLAVGAAYECSGATGIGGDQADNSACGSGAVYIY